MRIKLKEFKIMGFYVPHDNTPNFGFLIEHEEIGRLLYLTDLEYCPYSFKNLYLSINNSANIKATNQAST